MAYYPNYPIVAMIDFNICITHKGYSKFHKKNNEFITIFGIVTSKITCKQHIWNYIYIFFLGKIF